MLFRVTAVNALSLVCGIVGNIFLLLNFTQTVRYIIALPVTIILWFLATGMVSISTLCDSLSFSLSKSYLIIL